MELETSDLLENTAILASGRLTLRVSTPHSPLWYLALSIRRIMRFDPRLIAYIGIFPLIDTLLSFP
ncbi:MAG: hypothetical protein ACE5FZ_03120 [Nitrospiria bacterium]